MALEAAANSTSDSEMAPHCAVNDVDPHFFVGYAAQLFCDGLDRPINIAFNYHPQILDVTLLDLIV